MRAHTHKHKKLSIHACLYGGKQHAHTSHTITRTHQVLGREIRVDFAKGKSAGAGGGAGGAGGGVRPMQEKPEGCTTLFCGNLNFNIDDDAMKDFFKDCGEVSSIRWLTDRDTGDFKGCGFVEFSDPDTSLDKAAAMNGNELMGRAVRLDYAAPRKPREKTW